MNNKKIVEKFRESCGEEIGYISGLFMSQGDIKAKDIIMPTEELSEAVDRIELYLFEALEAQKQEIKEMIEESLWQCPMHKELQTDGSCKECNQGLEHNIALYALLKSIKKL